MYYNWAVNIKNMIHLLDNSAQQVDWIVMEREDCSPCNIGATLLSPIHLNNKNYNKNPIIHSTIRTWKQIKQNLKLRNLSLLIPIVNNPLFKPSIIDKSFIQWERMGIKMLGDLYELGKLLSFQQLQLKYNLKNNQYFKYLQIRDYLKKYTKDYHNMPTDLLDEAMKTKAESANLISYLYNIILNIEIPTTDGIRRDWEQELAINISKESWDNHLLQVHKCSINVRHTLIQFKTLHRLYYSKTKINKLFPNVSPICDKCLCQEATIAHSFVFCTKIQKFWNEIFDIFTKLIKIKLVPKPEWIIFGISEGNPELNVFQKNLLNYGLIMGKKAHT
ncbi:uncharacterized protein LOC129711249 [Leucoraja erinacea]|uniref:uncharacterized protein LOC129711249 n=1 Tax=Leucoraja erinaceus TaxID=7782 RepID=UPI0024575FAE|nr:uncharacterized protein LOC129711249 [Leucoraja erinacea]XP_055514747.1 uncharacterized protein LOC129711249 [Leucoraja erinacea]XP_055514748.1 uncharacterized protein LOC129711249 [Leucoraja erinacea]